MLFLVDMWETFVKMTKAARKEMEKLTKGMFEVSTFWRGKAPFGGILRALERLGLVS